MLKRLSLAGPLILPLLLIAGLIAAFVAFSGIRELVPPKTLSMAAGRPGGGYWQIAERYQQVLARDGIELTILETAGSMENSRSLAYGRAEVALIQGGVPVDPEHGLQALAGVFLEPFFVFSREGAGPGTDLTSWDGLRVAAGEPGGGTRVAINAMARALGVRLDQNLLLPLAGAEAAQALLDDRVDVAVFVAPLEAPYLQRLLLNPEIRISSPRDGAALARRLDYVRRVDIPPAGLDYSRRLPPRQVELVAMVAMLAVQPDLHPALLNRLVRAAEEIHGGGTLLSDDLHFPITEGVGLPLNAQAVSALQGGPGLLERVLPYWIAAQITRVTILIVPLLVLLIPLLRMVPGLYAWQMRARVYRRYNELVAIDAEAEDALTDARRSQLLRQLDQIDQEAKAVQVPVKYREYVYTLRLHIDLVRRKLAEAERAT